MTAKWCGFLQKYLCVSWRFFSADFWVSFLKKWLRNGADLLQKIFMCFLAELWCGFLSENLQKWLRKWCGIGMLLFLLMFINISKNKSIPIPHHLRSHFCKFSLKKPHHNSAKKHINIFCNKSAPFRSHFFKKLTQKSALKNRQETHKYFCKNPHHFAVIFL